MIRSECWSDYEFTPMSVKKHCFSESFSKESNRVTCQTFNNPHFHSFLLFHQTNMDTTDFILATDGTDIDLGTTLIDDTEMWSELDSFLYFIFYAVALLITLALFIWHSVNVFSDLCTKSRKSLKHCRRPPPLTAKYKLSSILSYCSILLYTIYLAVCTAQMTHSTQSQCLITTYLWTFPWLLSKATMYCTFLLRLDMIYSQSVYGYNRHFIHFLMALVVVCSCSLSSLLISNFSIQNALFLLDDDSLPNPCFVYFPSWGYTSFLVYDFVANSVCLVLFIVPIVRATSYIRSKPGLPAMTTSTTTSNSIKSMNSIKSSNSLRSSPTRRSRRPSDRMIYVGIKLLMITAVCVCTTVLTLSLLATGYFGYLCAVDVVVNCVCVMMMTAYYPDNKYYERGCGLCLFLCCCCRCCPGHGGHIPASTPPKVRVQSTSANVEV